MNFCIDEKDEERERARLSRDGEGRAFHPTPPPTPAPSAHFVVTPGGGAWGGVECVPFTVTAESRSLSLFTFFVDVKSLAISVATYTEKQFFRGPAAHEKMNKHDV